MIKQIMLKISFEGVLNYITLKDNLTLYNLMEKIIERFQIPEDDINLLELCDEDGYSFCEDSFNYFIQIFPAPERIFYTKLNYQKIQEPSKNLSNIFSKAPETNNEKLQSKKSEITIPRNKRLTFRNNNYGAPVIRQNCFIGEVFDFKGIKDSNYCTTQSPEYQSNKRKSSTAFNLPKRMRI